MIIIWINRVLKRNCRNDATPCCLTSNNSNVRCSHIPISIYICGVPFSIMQKCSTRGKTKKNEEKIALELYLYIYIVIWMINRKKGQQTHMHAANRTFCFWLYIYRWAESNRIGLTCITNTRLIHVMDVWRACLGLWHIFNN